MGVNVKKFHCICQHNVFAKDSIEIHQNEYSSVRHPDTSCLQSLLAWVVTSFHVAFNLSGYLILLICDSKFSNERNNRGNIRL